MENIIVVDCFSTGVNFIKDIVNMGYHPVVLELKPNPDDVEGYKQKMQLEYSNIEYDFDLIYEQDSYEDTLDSVRKLNPLLVIPGSEHGVVLATKLGNDLNLLCNPIENLEAMTKKDKMHERLKENGLRYIRGKVIYSVEEAIEFYESESLNEVVLKPTYSTGSTSVRICLNKEEMIEHVEELFNNIGRFGDKITEILIQERINGEEYVVNTVSNAGIHRITTIWKYSKVKTPDGAFIYDSVWSVNDLSIGEAELIEYAYDVADAIGIKYGAVHGEFMIDKDGPVLIEVNCRVMGGHIPSGFLDKVSGQHETDSILDSYLNPERFLERRKERYNLASYGAFKMFIVNKDLIARSAPINSISPKLKSHYATFFDDLMENEKFYIKTEDVRTSCGLVFLAHEDANLVHEDIKFLRSVEKYAFDLILSEEIDGEYTLNKNIIIEKLKLVIEATQKYGNGILITDQPIFGVDILQIGLDDIKSVNGTFDYVLINLNETFIDRSDTISVDIVYDIFSFIKVGGLIFIPDTSYRYVPGGRKGIEALVKSFHLKIEVPPYGIKNAVIASKRH